MEKWAEIVENSSKYLFVPPAQPLKHHPYVNANQKASARRGWLMPKRKLAKKKGTISQSLSCSHVFVFLRESVSCALVSRLFAWVSTWCQESASKDRRSGHAEWGTIVASLIDMAPSRHKRIGTTVLNSTNYKSSSISFSISQRIPAKSSLPRCSFTIQSWSPRTHDYLQNKNQNKYSFKNTKARCQLHARDRH